MTHELFLRRKWTLQAEGKRQVFVKRENEQTSHVLMKAFLWALYLPTYPDLSVEVAVGDRYKPDVVSLDETGQPRFWGECGKVTAKKMHALVRRYGSARFAVAKWATRLDPHRLILAEALRDIRRRQPLELLSFPEDAGQRFISDEGRITIGFEDVTRIQL